MGNRHRLLAAVLAAAAVMTGCVAQASEATYSRERTGKSEASTHRDYEVAEAAALGEDTGSIAARTIASITPSMTGQALEMQSLNSDVMGWLRVPGTDIDGVIVQNPMDEGNNYYLNHDFFGNPDKNGLFCADKRCDLGSGMREDLPRNITLYGHSWDDDPDGVLFGQLKRYRDPDYASKNPYIYFSSTSEDFVWEIFAVYDTTIDLPYVWPELSPITFKHVFDVALESSMYDYGVALSKDDRILTLSTCTYDVYGVGELPTEINNDYRFVIMARLVPPDDEIKEQVSFEIKDTRLAPDNIPFITPQVGLV